MFEGEVAFCVSDVVEGRGIKIIINKLNINKIPLKRDASGPEGYSDPIGLDWNLCIV